MALTCMPGTARGCSRFVSVSTRTTLPRRPPPRLGDTQPEKFPDGVSKRKDWLENGLLFAAYPPRHARRTSVIGRDSDAFSLTDFARRWRQVLPGGR
jgi:hypothetical protein